MYLNWKSQYRNSAGSKFKENYTDLKCKDNTPFQIIYKYMHLTCANERGK